VLLPAASGGPESIHPKGAAPERSKVSGFILVIDDDQAVRNVAKRALERVGYQVLTAADGVLGLEVFSAHKDEIRAVLLDVTMPRMGGEETFRRLRQVAPDVCVLLSSGYSEQEATSVFAGKGLAGFLEKPFTTKTLLDKLRGVLEAAPAKAPGDAPT
jgi:CheY-like chemotaxis protein